MLVTSPRSVKFGSVLLAGVRAVAIERQAIERVEEHDQSGPFCVLADVVRQRTAIRIERTAEDASWALAAEFGLGFQGELVIHAAIGGSDAGLVRLSTLAVLTGVEYRLNDRPATQVLTFLAVSGSGESDPLSVNTNVNLEGA